MPLEESCCPNSSEPLERKDAPPSCMTCPHFYKDSPTRYSLCREFDQQIDGEDIGFVSHRGCLSHPLARAWLNRDVIRELERRIGRLGAYPDNTQAIRVYKETIALLKGEAKE